MHTPTDLEFPAKRLGKQPSEGRLTFTSTGIIFYPTSEQYRVMRIDRSEIINFAINRTDTRTEEVTPLGVFFFGIWAFLFPQKSGDLSITIAIQTRTFQARFLIDEETIENIRTKIDYYFDAWNVPLTQQHL